MAETITITVPQEFAHTLQEWAQEQQVSRADLVTQVVQEALGHKQIEQEPTLEEIVEEIIALGPDPRHIEPASGSLEEALADAPADPTFNLAEWQREWATAEAEMHAITRANDIAEGRV